MSSNFTQVQRFHAAKLVVSKGHRIADVAKLKGVSTSTIRRWLDEYTDMTSRAPRTLENAWLVHIEIHVGNDTRHLHQVIYANNEVQAAALMADMEPDYRGNTDPAYSLQIKSGPWKLTDHHEYLSEY